MKFIFRTIIQVILSFTVIFIQGCTTVTPRSLDGLDSKVRQVLIVYPKQKSSRALLSAWQKDVKGWQCLWQIRAVIGRNGMSAIGQKKEGDGKTPAGIYPLGPVFGYAPSMDTGLDYRQATANDFWVDDSASMQYNQWIRGKPQARSFERMKRSDNLYQLGIVIGYNENPIVPGAGSAIFLHIWRKYYSPTVGCVAISQRYLRKILRWLNKANQPVIILEKINA